MKHIKILGSISVPSTGPYSSTNYVDIEPGFYVADATSSYEGSLCCISLSENGDRKICMFYEDYEKEVLKDAMRDTAPLYPTVSPDRMVINFDDIIRLTASVADPSQAKALIK